MYEISKSEILILRAVTQGHDTISKIQGATGLSITRTSELTSELAEKGFLVKKREGMQKKIFFSENKHCALLRQLLTSELKVENIITDSKINILFSINHTPKDPARIAAETKLSADTARKYLGELKKFGIIRSKNNKQAQVSPSAAILLSFLQEYADYINRKTLPAVASKGTMLWEQGREIIFKTPVKEKVKNAIPTAVTALSTHGIDIISEFSYYYYAPWAKTLRNEDIAIHTILLDKNSIRYLSYALLLLKKTGYKKGYLLEKGKEYKIENIIKDMTNYLSGKKTKKPFPSQKEFKILCAQYGVE
ncbi:MAG: hypothetical protein QMC80_01120 [Thermoplasmatales archaeon]|nr:hypothetical protein [Thermoplasmatales archaeon]